MEGKTINPFLKQKFGMLVKIVHFFVTEFLQFALNQEEYQQRWQAAVLKSERLQAELKMANKYISVLEAKLIHAQCSIDKEKQKRCEAEICISELVRFSAK
jgi:hypothetical protein